jgi:hypothetical protein
MAKQKTEAEKERADVAPMAAQADAEPPEEEAEQDEPERLNHWQAAHRVVKAIDGDTCLSELAYEADQLVVQSGGNSNETRAWNNVYNLLQTMSELDIFELTEDVQVHPLHRLPSANGRK